MHRLEIFFLAILLFQVSATGFVAYSMETHKDNMNNIYSKHPELENECKIMYEFREKDIKYPFSNKNNEKYCNVITEGNKDSWVSLKDYNYITHRSLRFTCKGKRPILYDLVSLLENCDGNKRTIFVVKNDDGSCSISVKETNKTIISEKYYVDELENYLDDMNSFEYLLYSSMLPTGISNIIDETKKCF